MSKESRTQRRLAREATRERVRRLEAVRAAQYALQPEARPKTSTLVVIAVVVMLLLGFASYAASSHVPREYVKLSRAHFESRDTYNGWREFVRRFGMKGIPSGCNAGVRLGTDGTQGWHYMMDCPLGLRLIPSAQ